MMSLPWIVPIFFMIISGLGLGFEIAMDDDDEIKLTKFTPPIG